ncbi:MAG: hypothetical protein ACRD96_25650 [Bryobacteraceae bacterium]
MLRNLVRFLLVIGVLALARYVMALVAGAFSPGRPDASKSPVPAAADCKRDPVCGTFVAAASSVTKEVGGNTIHFCSAACRDKYQVT